jgi:hypothetical protein
MSRFRTSLVVLAAGAVVVTAGVVVATSATAAPTPVAAVDQLALPVDGRVPATGGLPAGARARGWWKHLTDEQRSCLKGAGITRPVGPLDDAERATLRAKVEAAAETCDVELPFAKARAFWNTLTDEQRACLEDAALTRPWGPLTKDERRAVRSDLRAAAKACGVTVAPQS